MPIFVIKEHHARSKHWDFRLDKNKANKNKIIPQSYIQL